MTTFNKKNLLSDLHDRVELIRNNMQPFLRLPEEYLAYKPAPGKWSVTDIFEHLNITHGFLLNSISNVMSDAPINARERFTSGWIGNFIYNNMMPRPDGTIFKMKSPRKFRISGKVLNGREVLDTFMDQLDEFEHILELCPYIDLQKMKVPFSLPLGIRLRLGDSLRFIVAHSERHLLQARNTLALVPAV